MSIRDTFLAMGRTAALSLALAAGILLAGGARPASADLTEAQLQKMIAIAKQMAAEPVVIEAVKRHNAQKMPMAEVMKIQADWKAGKAPQLAQALMTNDCAKRLAAIQAPEKSLLEVAVMDEQGTRVCITNKTSNYWRGDKAKFKDAYKNGEGAVYVGKPEYDASTEEYTTELSVPVMAGGRAIGVVSFEVLSKKR